MNAKITITEGYIPISLIFEKEVCKKIDEQMEKVYNFAKSNMISITEVPGYISNSINNKKYANYSLNSEILNLPDFIYKIANRDINLTKLSQKYDSNEEETQAEDDSGQWQKSWWATGLSFLPGFGTIIPLVNLIRSSGSKCSSSFSWASWPCIEAIFDVIGIIADLITVFGIILALPSWGGSLTLSYLGTTAKTLKPIIKLLIATGKGTGLAKIIGGLSFSTLKLLKGLPYVTRWVARLFAGMASRLRYAKPNSRLAKAFYSAIRGTISGMDGLIVWFERIAQNCLGFSDWLEKLIVSTGHVPNAAKLESKISTTLATQTAKMPGIGPEVVMAVLKNPKDEERAVAFLTKEMVAYVEDGVVKLGKPNLTTQTFEEIGKAGDVMLRNNPILQTLSRANMPTDIAKNLGGLGVKINKPLSKLTDVDREKEVLNYIKNHITDITSSRTATHILDDIAEIYGKDPTGKNIVKNLNDFSKKIFGVSYDTLKANLKNNKAVSIAINQLEVAAWYAKKNNLPIPPNTPTDIFNRYVAPNKNKIYSDYIMDIAKRVFKDRQTITKVKDLKGILTGKKLVNNQLKDVALHSLNYRFDKNKLLSLAEKWHGEKLPLSEKIFSGMAGQFALKWVPSVRIIYDNVLNITGIRSLGAGVQIAYFWALDRYNQKIIEYKEEAEAWNNIFSGMKERKKRERGEDPESVNASVCDEKTIAELRSRGFTQEQIDQLCRDLQEAKRQIDSTKRKSRAK